MKVITEEAKEILQKHLGDEYEVLRYARTEHGSIQFEVKRRKYLNDPDVWPEIYGVDTTTKEIIDFDEIIKRDRDREETK